MCSRDASEHDSARQQGKKCGSFPARTFPPGQVKKVQRLSPELTACPTAQCPTLGLWACTQIPGGHLADAIWSAPLQVTAESCSLGSRAKAREMEEWEGRNLIGTGGDRTQGSGLSHVQLQANCFKSTLSCEALWPLVQGFGGLQSAERPSFP